MLIRNDVKNIEVEKEIQHIVENLNLIIRKIGCKTFVLNNRNTIEDVAFMEIYLNNPQINANLMYFNMKDSKYENNRIKYLESKEDFISLTYNLFENHNIAIINTDTLFLENAKELKANYNIEIFKDYSSQFIEEILKFYNNYNGNIFTQLEIPMSEKSQEILIDYLNNENLPNKYTREELLKYQEELPRKFAKRAMIYNSITTNYIKGVNTDLEKFMD